MFTRTSINAFELPVGARGMATGRQLRARMKSVTGLRKITKAMNLIAAAKVRKSQTQLDRARIFSRPIIDAWAEPARDKEFKHTGNVLLVPIVADRGLCGAANSSIIRECKKKMIEINSGAGEAKNIQLVIFGEKGRTGLERLYKKNFLACLSDLGKIRSGLNFKQVALLSEHILSAQFDSADIVYNRFKNMMSYFTTIAPLNTLDKSIETGKFEQFELEGDADILRNFYEYRIAVRMFNYFCEADATEQSARTTAMANSSKSADDMLAALRLQYNRSRQTKITQELMEIIGGMIGLSKDK